MTTNIFLALVFLICFATFFMYTRIEYHKGMTGIQTNSSAKTIKRWYYLSLFNFSVTALSFLWLLYEIDKFLS